MALLARNVQGRAAAVLGLVDRRASLDKQPGDLEVTILARDEQRREAVSVCLVTAAPAAIIRRTQSIWPAMLASRRGAVILAAASASRSSWTICSWPFSQSHALHSGVAPLTAAWLTAALAARCSRTHSRRPFWHAMNSGVKPPPMAWLTAALAPRSSRAHPGWPFWHAMDSGVVPLTSTWLTAALASRTRGGRAASPGCPGTGRRARSGGSGWRRGSCEEENVGVEEFYNEGDPADA